MRWYSWKFGRLAWSKNWNGNRIEVGDQQGAWVRLFLGLYWWQD